MTALSGSEPSGLIWFSRALRNEGGIHGRPLAGDRFVRFVYLDEAGASFEDPVTVVAAVMVHGDRQWKATADAISKLTHEVQSWPQESGQ